MKKEILIVMLISLALATPVLAATVYNIPFYWEGTREGGATNPTGQPAGIWSVDYAAGNNWTTGSELTPMAYWESTWLYTTGAKYQGGYWHASGHTGWDAANVLTFQCPETGYYSIDSVWELNFSGGDSTDAYMDIRVAPDETAAATTVWSRWYSLAAGGTAKLPLDLSAESALQDAYLTAGSFIYFTIRAASQPYYPAFFTTFRDTDSGNLGGSIIYSEIPEPATIGLLALACVLGFRKK